MTHEEFERAAVSLLSELDLSFLEAKPPHKDIGFVYFAHCEEKCRVKVGWSRDPARRLSGLRTASPFPLRLMFALRGGQWLESAIHRAFAKYHVQGEWFSPAFPFIALGSLVALESRKVNAPELT